MVPNVANVWAMNPGLQILGLESLGLQLMHCRLVVARDGVYADDCLNNSACPPGYGRRCAIVFTISL